MYVMSFLNGRRNFLFHDTDPSMKSTVSCLFCTSFVGLINKECVTAVLSSWVLLIEGEDEAIRKVKNLLVSV